MHAFNIRLYTDMPHSIYAPQNTIRMEKKITYMGKLFKLTTFESTNGIRIFIGGHSNIYCLEGFIYKDTVMNNSYIDKSVGQLVQVYYDQACSLNGDFEKGIDTRNLIHLFLSIVKKNFTHVTQIKLTDASTKVCDNGSEVSLSNMLYARRGKTWYEHHFKATLDTKYTAMFDNAVRRFTAAKDTFSWEQFTPFIKGDLPLPQQEMKEIYNKATTWQEFFSTVANRIGDAEFCEFVSPWLNDFMATIMGFNFVMGFYYIPLTHYQQREYTVSPFTGGGRKRYTIRRGRIEKAQRHSRALE